MSIDSAREAMTRYLKSNHSDLSMMAPDVVFTSMATGDEHRGVEALAGMLHYIYHVAFDAHAETRNLIVTEGHAVLEGDFVGKHIGEFAGVRPPARSCASRSASSMTSRATRSRAGGCTSKCRRS